MKTTYDARWAVIPEIIDATELLDKTEDDEGDEQQGVAAILGFDPHALEINDQ